MQTFGHFCMNPGDGTGFVKLSNESFYMQNSTYNTGANRIIFLDTRNGEFAINVLDNPESGDMIFFIDIGGNLKLEPVRLFKLGKVFGQDLLTTQQYPTPEPYLLLDKRFAIYRFIYVNDVVGWIYDIDYLNTSGSDDPVGDTYISDILNQKLNTYDFASNPNLTSLISSSINNYDFTSKITQTINNITNQR